MKIFDCHIHLFTTKIIDNIRKRKELVKWVKLQMEGAAERIGFEALERDMMAGGVTGALLLPTANVNGVKKTNRDCIKTARQCAGLKTAGTLHPDFLYNDNELVYLKENQVRMIKLCSFSQGFALDAPSTLKMFDAIQSANESGQGPFTVVLDTLQRADYFFGTSPAHNTSPKGLGHLADQYPGINFIGAHMGGLGAPIDELCRYLTPRPNLYLDTSNAVHTLNAQEFRRLLDMHGPGHILFGTDWPWFTHGPEVEHVTALLDQAACSEQEKQAVFHDNLAGLLGL